MLEYADCQTISKFGHEHNAVSVAALLGSVLSDSMIRDAILHSLFRFPHPGSNRPCLPNVLVGKGFSDAPGVAVVVSRLSRSENAAAQDISRNLVNSVHFTSERLFCLLVGCPVSGSAHRR
ncbi:hypothetical protein [Nocardia nova]|uniref:hypothetical protein n=1 Tax=Nocardia nova TaxID=37330 RepID=UPI0033D3FCBE